MAYEPISMDDTKSDSLVVHCSDPRFQDNYRKAIDELGEYYDLLVIPGPSKALAENKPIQDYIQLLYDLHQFKKVHIYDHMGCGMFHDIQDEHEGHEVSLTAAEAKLKELMPGVEVQVHLLGPQNELPIEKKDLSLYNLAPPDPNPPKS
jgi:hypothetical protein